VSIVTMGIGVGALLAGLFGMNLLSYLEEDKYAFFIISGVCVAAASAVTVTGLRRLSRIRKVGLGGNPLSLDGSRQVANRSSSSEPKRRPWLPLPLRRRGGDS